jgi:hypothetical protein
MARCYWGLARPAERAAPDALPELVAGPAPRRPSPYRQRHARAAAQTEMRALAAGALALLVQALLLRAVMTA